MADAAPTRFLSPSQPMNVNPNTVEKAITALFKWREAKSTIEKPQLLEHDEFVYLTVTLKKIPQRSRTNPYRIPLPHALVNPIEESPELCLIIDDREKSGLTKDAALKKIKSENIPISKVIKLSKLQTDYRPFEAKRKLCDSYDMFFADRRVIPLLPRLLGKKFFKSRKIPVAISLNHRTWKEQIEKACKAAMFFMRTGTCSVVKVGKLSMESNDITENVIAAVNGIAGIVSSKWKNIRSLHLKLSGSLALPIYQTVPDLKLKIDASGDAKGVMENLGDELAKSDIDYSKSNEESVSMKTKKKKGRIHEVRYMDSCLSETLDEEEIGVDSDDDIAVGEEKENEQTGTNGSGDKKRKKTGKVAKSEKSQKKVAKEEKKSDDVKLKAKSKDGMKAKKQKKDGAESGSGLKEKMKRKKRAVGN